MDAALFTRLFSDKSVTDLKKLSYKYPQANIREFVSLLKNGFYQSLPLPDSDGGETVYLENVTRVHLSAAKLLLRPQHGPASYGIRAMEEEIISTFRLEQIDTTRESVRRVLSGYAPNNETENRVYGMKRGLEFIADPAHRITEENLHQLYQTTIGEFLSEESRLLPGARYRHDTVYVVGSKIEHTGLPWQELPQRMRALITFAQQESEMDDLLKAAALHFYLAYLHPYFDGNGRIARLLHLWYLVQQGYPSALFVPLSNYIEKSRSRYYRAYSQVEANFSFSGVLDITPFLVYFIENVYHQLGGALPCEQTAQAFQAALQNGNVTEKENALWQFVLSAYGDHEFSTKQLEKDFGNAAYATIRGFVLKFTDMGLLSCAHYGQRIKYRIHCGSSFDDPRA